MRVHNKTNVLAKNIEKGDFSVIFVELFIHSLNLNKYKLVKNKQCTGDVSAHEHSTRREKRQNEGVPY